MLHKTVTLAWLCLWEEVLIAHWFMFVWTLLSQDLFSQNFLTARTSSVRPTFFKPLMVQAESLLIKAPSHQDVGVVGGQIIRILRLLSVLKFTRILLFLDAIFVIQFLLGFGTHFKLKWASPFLTPITPSNSSSPYARFILNAKLIFIASFSFCVTLHWNLT